jgi:hypothetical protein
VARVALKSRPLTGSAGMPTAVAILLADTQTPTALPYGKMTPPDIIRKLEAEVGRGITTQAQALYLMAGIRKLLEQQQAKKQYEYLTFHCDWALHSKLGGPTAQKILKLFDAAHIHLKTGVELQDLPPDLRTEIERISKMQLFEQELYQFLQTNGLPSLGTNRSDLRFRK